MGTRVTEGGSWDKKRTADVSDNSPEYFERLAEECHAMDFPSAITEALRAAAVQARENAELRNKMVNAKFNAEHLRNKANAAESANRALQAEVDRLRKESGARFVGLLAALNYFDGKGYDADTTRSMVIDAIAYTGTDTPKKTP